MKQIFILLLLCGASFAQLTQVTATVIDPNANPYASGTASAYQVVGNGQPATSTTPVPTSTAGLFTMFLPAATYLFTVCAPPPLLGVPTTNPSPKQVCFSSGPIVISGATQDISTQLNAIAVVIGPMQSATGGGGGGGGGGGINIGNLTPGCVPVGAAAGSATPLVCSPFTYNGQVMVGSAPLQIPTVTAVTPNTGEDFTGGDCSNLTFQAQHSYLCSDSAFNYGLHAFVNGNDTNAVLLTNPVGLTYHVDGFVNTSICQVVQNVVPANSTATIYVDILTPEELCDPFNQGRTVRIYLSAQVAPYLFAVPLRIGPDEILGGAGRGLSGTNTRGTTVMPGPDYVSPFVGTAPNGFTLTNTTSGCTNGFPSNGNYLVEISWGPDTTRETLPAQETTVALNGTTQCFRVIPPVSPPANVTTYDVYITGAGGTSGQEHWQGQSSIANPITISWSGSPQPAGSGKPPHINTTGIFIVVGNANGPQANLNGTQATFGARLQDLSINCLSANCIPTGILTGEEDSGIFRVGVIQIGTTASPGLAGIVWEGYGNVGLGASNSLIEDFTINAAQSGGGDATVASLFIDNMTRGRGVNRFTITPTISTTPTCILFSNPDGSAGGMSVSNGHMEKCPDGLFSVGAATVAFNLSCSPSNIQRCVHWDSTTASSAAFNIAGGVVSIQDDTTGFSSTQAVVGNYSNFYIGYFGITAGAAPTCQANPVNPGPNLLGTTGTCLMDTGSNNNAGVMNLTANGGSETTTGVIQLNFASPGLGVNGTSCTFTPVSAGTAWPNNTTWRGTQFGTGNVQALWIPGGGTGTAFANGNTFKIAYHCSGY